MRSQRILMAMFPVELVDSSRVLQAEWILRSASFEGSQQLTDPPK